MRHLVLGSIGEQHCPLDRLDVGVFLSVFQRLRPSDESASGIRVDSYEYRVGWAASKSTWLVRYEFRADPTAEFEGQYPYARSHFHVNAASPNGDFLSELPKRHFPTRKLLLEEVLAGVCADIILPRLRQKQKDTSDVERVLERLQERIASLTTQA